MKNKTYTITSYCNFCKTHTKQLVQDISTQEFKDFTKSEFTFYCGQCGLSQFITKEEYQRYEYTKEEVIKPLAFFEKARLFLESGKYEKWRKQS